MMFTWVGKVVSKLWTPLKGYVRMHRHGNEDDSVGGAPTWCKDLEKHAFGEFSFAVVQANDYLEDQSQVEVGRDATFIGVYDGHGGTETSCYVCDHLFSNFIQAADEQGLINEHTLRSAISTTEAAFLSVVRDRFQASPYMAAVGSCCLVGVIWNRKFHVCNVGDSRAVLGRLINRINSSKIVAEQMTLDHNACMEDVRRDLQLDHPDDPDIVVQTQGVWRVKGIIQVSRTIGDGYLKRPEFALGPSFPKFHLRKPLHKPILRSDPHVYNKELQPNDKFVVFASDGLWEHITNQEAVEFVHNNPRSGIARKLIKLALKEAARKKGKKYRELKRVQAGARRRTTHDDITVIVIFIDHELLGSNAVMDEISVRGFSNMTRPSEFLRLQGL